MAYLMIENKGVAPLTAFTVLGATTKRDSDIPGLIGTFGSGANMGTLDLLRHEIHPIVYCGNDRLEFSTRPLSVEDVRGETTHHRQVYVTYGGSSKKKEKLSWTTAYGERDWSSIDFALREYISNAIDALLTQGIDRKSVWAYINVEIVEDAQVRAKSGHTRVFVPATEDVRSFYNHLECWFLHVLEGESLESEVLPKNGRNVSYDRGMPTQRAVIYRRGVRVREFESDDKPSLFDYNLDNLKLNESRQVDDWGVLQEVGKAIKNAQPSVIACILKAVIRGENIWEASLSEYGLRTTYSDNKDQINANWLAAIKSIGGENAVIVSQESVLAQELLKRKGYNPIPVPSAYAQAIQGYGGLPTAEKVLTQDEQEGRELFDANDPLINTLNRIWSAVEKYGMTNGKQKPSAKLFHEHMKAECERFGFYKDNTVFVHKDYATAENDALSLTVIEEVCHHITKAQDSSRDFQMWLIRFLAIFLK